MTVILSPDSASARCRRYLAAQGGRWVASVELARIAGVRLNQLPAVMRRDADAGRVQRRGSGAHGVQWRVEPPAVSWVPDWPPAWVDLQEAGRGTLRGRAY